MAIIGRFTKVGDSFDGIIATLGLKENAVRIVAEDKQPTPNSPSPRVFCGEFEVGAAWPRGDAAGNRYLNLRIDDPGLPEPFYPALVRGDDDRNFVLLWSRSNSPRSTD